MDSLFAAVEDEFDAGIGMGIGVAHMNEQPTHPSNTPADQFSKGQSSFLSTVPLPLPSTPSVSNQSHLPFQSPFLQQASPMQMPIFNNQFKPYQINPNSNLNPYQFQQPLLQHPQQQALHAQAQQHAMFQYQYQQQQQQQQQLQQMNLSKHYHQPQLQGYQPSISQYQQPQSQINHTLNIPTSSTPNPFVYPKLLNDSVMNDNDGTENNIGSKKRKEDSLKEEPDVSKMNLESMLDVTSYGGVNVNEENDNLASLAALFPSSKQTAYVRNQCDFFNTAALRLLANEIGKQHGIESMGPNFLEYITRAVKERCTRLMEQMIITSKHRTMLLHTSFLSRDKLLLFKNNPIQPLDVHIKVTDSIKQTLAKLEKADVEEDRQLRLDRGLDVESIGVVQGPVINMSQAIGTSKKMIVVPEQVKSKLVNETALKATGGTLKSWMLPTTSKSNSEKIKNLSIKTGESQGTTEKEGYIMPVGEFRGTLLRLARPMTQKESKRITLKDGLVCLENDVHLKNSKICQKFYVMNRY